MTDSELAPLLATAAPKKTVIVTVALICFGIASLGFLDRTAGLGLKLGLAIPFGVIGLALLIVGFRPATKHPAIALLRERPDEVVWIYPLAQTVNGRPSQTFVSIGTASGASYAIAIGARTDPTPYLELLRRAIPHATYGHSAELAAKYKSDPASLRVGRASVRA